jgi:dihydrofolate synthase/folylpolyglutamate synthase
MQPEFDIELYNKRLEELFSRFQSVQKVGFTGDAYKPGLSGMLRFSAVLGDPWKAYPCVHVAGTNGKGSVCSMLASALAAGGAVLTGGHPRRAKGTAVSRKGSPVRALPVRILPDGSSRRQHNTTRIGLYTSPHLLDFRERIKVVSADGYEMISQEEVWEFLNSYEEAFEGLSFFEITTGMAFWWFARKGVDAAVIEAGLGGRLDSTNIITPVLSVVTSIGLDHCALLGSTRAAIAREKAGIFKPGVPAVVGGRDAETAPVFEEVAALVGTPLTFASDVPAFSFEQDLLSGMDLTGPCQDINLHTVLVALDILFDLPYKQPKTRKVMALEAAPSLKTAKNKEGHGFGDRTFLENSQNQGRSQGEMIKVLIEAIANAGKRTGLWGRWQRICEKPEVICDIGHNPPALKENFARLEALQSGKKGDETQAGDGNSKSRDGIQATKRNIIIVYGIMADKDLAGIAPLMPAGAKYILAAPDNQRALPADQLKARLAKLRPDLETFVADDSYCTGRANDKQAAEPYKRGSVAAAVRQALDLAQDLPNPLIYIGGSTFVVAEALPLFNENTEP